MTMPKASADQTTGPLPFRTSTMQIEPQCAHLNMAYYNVLFDRAIDQFWLELGIGSD